MLRYLTAMSVCGTFFCAWTMTFSVVGWLFITTYIILVSMLALYFVQNVYSNRSVRVRYCCDHQRSAISTYLSGFGYAQQQQQQQLACIILILWSSKHSSRIVRSLPELVYSRKKFLFINKNQIFTFLGIFTYQPMNFVYCNSMPKLYWKLVTSIILIKWVQTAIHW